MELMNRYAFKEWAAICEAIAVGRQSILVRKGGIHEGRSGFTVDHREFWLFPTRFHEGAEDLSEEGQRFLARARERLPEMGFVGFSTYFEVTDVVELVSENEIGKLRPFHVYADHVLTQRFLYKRPGLTVLIGRASVLETEPIIIPDSPHFGGCRSWVDLPTPLATSGTRSVIGDEEFAERRRQLRASLQQRTVV